MFTGGRITRATFVWVTAFATLATGFPRLDCRCPDGRLKRFCLSLAASECCCAGSCCPPVKSGNRAPGARSPFAHPGDCPACRHGMRAPEGKPPSKGPAVGVAGCAKTLAERSPRPNVGATPADDAKAQTKHLLTASVPMYLPAACQPRGNHAGTDAPPPLPDLVILLRHLLI